MRFDHDLHPAYRKYFPPRESERLAILSRLELEREHTHPDKVAAMDPFEVLRDYCAHAEQQRALGRPIPRRAGTVFFARDHDQRHVVFLIMLRGVENCHLLTAGQMRGEAALDARHEQILEPDICERPA